MVTLAAPIKLKRRSSGSTGAPSSLLAGEPAYSAVDDILYIGKGDDGAGNALTVQPIAGAGAFVAVGRIGAVSGVAGLDGAGKVPTAQLPASIVGALQYQGTWNASTNTPTLASGTGTKGNFYKVSNAGSTALDGLSSWIIGDLVVFDGTTWDKIDGNPSEVTTVAGRTGAVTIASTDITDSTALGRTLLTAASVEAQRASLAIDTNTPIADVNKTQTASADRNIQYATLSAPRVVTLAAANSYNAGEVIRIGDRSGNCSGTNTITINRAGADTINGGTSTSLTIAYGQMLLETDGTSKWTIISQPPGVVTLVDAGTF